RDAGPDVPGQVARRVAADRLGGPGWRISRQAADEEADGAVEPVDAVDRLLGRVADIGERLVPERVADLGDAGQVPAAFADGVEVGVEVIVQLGREAVALAGDRGAVQGDAQVGQGRQEQAGDGRDEERYHGGAEAGAAEGSGTPPDHAADNGNSGHGSSREAPVAL